MKIKEILETNAQTVDWEKVGKAFALAVKRVQEEYNSVNIVRVSEDNVNVRMYAGSNVPIATFVRAEAKGLGIKPVWRFFKITDPLDHDYVFEMSSEIDKLAFKSGFDSVGLKDVTV